MKVLVVGATGFIGQALSELLSSAGHEVVGTSSNPGAANSFDLTDFSTCKRIMAKGDYDAIVNLAGRGATSGTASKLEMLEVNRDGVKNLAKAVFEIGNGAPFFIHVASSTEPSLVAKIEPESEYSRSKALGTEAVRDIFGSAEGHYAIARVHNTYGAQQPRGRFIASVISRLREGKPFDISYPARVRDFCYVDDVVENLARLLKGNDMGIYFEIGTGRGVSLLDVANTVCDTVSASPSLIRVRTPTLNDAHPYEVADTNSTNFLQCSTPLEEGIKITVKEMK